MNTSLRNQERPVFLGSGLPLHGPRNDNNNYLTNLSFRILAPRLDSRPSGPATSVAAEILRVDAVVSAWPEPAIDDRPRGAGTPLTRQREPGPFDGRKPDRHCSDRKADESREEHRHAASARHRSRERRFDKDRLAHSRGRRRFRRNVPTRRRARHGDARRRRRHRLDEPNGIGRRRRDRTRPRRVHCVGPSAGRQSRYRDLRSLLPGAQPQGVSPPLGCISFQHRRRCARARAALRGAVVRVLRGRVPRLRRLHRDSLESR